MLVFTVVAVWSRYDLDRMQCGFHVVHQSTADIKYARKLAMISLLKKCVRSNSLLTGSRVATLESYRLRVATPERISKEETHEARARQVSAFGASPTWIPQAHGTIRHMDQGG
jgi:hypothetical protein